MSETFDITNNLLQGKIPDNLFECSHLRSIRMSKNSIEGTMSQSFGKLAYLQELQIGENKLVGSLPQKLFECTTVESIVLDKNNIGGNIPSQIGYLSNLKTMSLSHNSLKGTIPTQMGNLTKLNVVQLDHNKLTGDAPKIIKPFKYSTDCGVPSFELANPLNCETCDRCCNSNGDCKVVVNRFRITVYAFSFLLAILAACIASGVVYFLKISSFHLQKDKDLNTLYSKESTNSFIFSTKKSARSIYALTIVFQTLLFVIYLLESESSAYSMNVPFVQAYAWVSFSLVILCFLGADLVMSLSQLREGFLHDDKSLCVSGALLLYITIVAMTTSFFYCSVSVENNTQLIVDAVILLFIMDLDDRIFVICKKTAPVWTEEVQEEVGNKLRTRFLLYFQRQNARRNLSQPESMCSQLRNMIVF